MFNWTQLYLTLPDLPDIPDDVTYDITFPQFQPRNRALGLESVYGKQEIGGDGLTKKQRKFEEDSAACDKKVDEMIMKQLDEVQFEELSEPEPAKMSNRRPKLSTTSTRQARNIPTIRSREAATALAGPKQTSATARTAPAPKPRAASSVLTAKKTRMPTNPSSMRHTAAAATSNTTISYSKGKRISSTLREKTEVQRPSSRDTTLSPEAYMRLYGPPPLGSDMWIRCKAAGCLDEQDGAMTTEPEESLQTLGEDEEAQSFQLAL